MIKYFILISFLLSFNVRAWHTGNGGDLSELNLIDAWTNFEYLQTRINSEAPQAFSDNEHIFIQLILKNKIKEPKELIFESSSKKPDFFPSHSSRKYALYKTSKEIGSKIYFNQDELYILEEEKPRSFNLGEAYALILEALTIRYNIDFKASLFLDKIIELMNRDVQIASLSMYRRSSLSLQVHPRNDRSIIITADTSIVDISNAIRDSLLCTNGDANDDFQLTTIDLKGLDKLIASFSGKLYYNCANIPMVADMEIKAKYVTNTPELAWNWYYDPSIVTSIKEEDIKIEVFNIKERSNNEVR